MSLKNSQFCSLHQEFAITGIQKVLSIRTYLYIVKLKFLHKYRPNFFHAGFNQMPEPCLGDLDWNVIRFHPGLKISTVGNFHKTSSFFTYLDIWTQSPRQLEDSFLQSISDWFKLAVFVDSKTLKRPFYSKICKISCVIPNYHLSFCFSLHSWRKSRMKKQNSVNYMNFKRIAVFLFTLNHKKYP